MLEPPDINGKLPPLAGMPCDELLVQQYRYRGELVDPANVVHLRFAGQWHRLFFDCGILFWRSHEHAPEGFVASEYEFAYPLVDLARQVGFSGVVLERMEAAPIEGGAEVRFAFRNGFVLVFTHVADTTTYQAEPSAVNTPATGAGPGHKSRSGVIR